MTDPKLTLTLTSPDLDAEALARLSQNLRRELLDLYNCVADAQFAPADAPELSKGVGGLDWNTIILTLIASGGVATTAITAVVTLTQACLKRNEGRNITIAFSNGSKLTAQNLTPEEQKRLAEALLRDARESMP